MSVFGGLPEWPKGADCKSAGYAFDGSNPSPSTAWTQRGDAGGGEGQRRVTPDAGGAEGQRRVTRGEENVAGVAQLVERQPSKLNVAGSNPVSRSRPESSREVRGAGT